MGELLYLFVAGALAIMAMVLPGISGSTLLLIFGVYAPTLYALRWLLALDLAVLPGLFALALGVLVGGGGVHPVDSGGPAAEPGQDALLHPGPHGGVPLCRCHGTHHPVSPQQALHLETFHLGGALSWGWGFSLGWSG